MNYHNKFGKRAYTLDEKKNNFNMNNFNSNMNRNNDKYNNNLNLNENNNNFFQKGNFNNMNRANTLNHKNNLMVSNLKYCNTFRETMNDNMTNDFYNRNNENNNMNYNNQNINNNQIRNNNQIISNNNMNYDDKNMNNNININSGNQMINPNIFKSKYIPDFSINNISSMNTLNRGNTFSIIKTNIKESFLNTDEICLTLYSEQLNKEEKMEVKTNDKLGDIIEVFKTFDWMNLYPIKNIQLEGADYDLDMDKTLIDQGIFKDTTINIYFNIE
jgi:hypothetical protein